MNLTVNLAFIFLVTTAGLPISVCAQESGLNILTVSPNTRALGLNDAVTSELNGASGIYTNPANLALEFSSGATADFNFWIGGITNRHAAVHFKRNSYAFGFGFLSSEADRGDAAPPGTGVAQGTTVSNLLSLAASFAYSRGSISAGVTGQYLLEEYYSYNASGYSLTAGLSGVWWNEIIRAGITLQNLGKMGQLHQESTKLPTTFRAGTGIRLFRFVPPKSQDLPIWISSRFDYVYLLQKPATTTLGADGPDYFANAALIFDIAETVSLYGGYKIGDTSRDWSAGVTITVGAIRANYAIVPFETGYTTAHSLGIEYIF